jgi:SAM-dependent methyltransferase
MTHPYSAEFYSTISASSYGAASVILPIVFQIVRARSVIDIGCGTGAWMAAAELLGATALGVEGRWIENAQKFKDSLDIRIHDLEQPLQINERFDLAICLEVAEHLPTDRSESLVQDLCSLSDFVLFSAAIPNQPGTNHVNCQWQSFWASLFEKNARFAIDIIRPKVWGNKTVPFWFQQNTLLYASASKAESYGLTEDITVAPDLVHPDMINLPPSVMQLLRPLPGAIKRSIKSKLLSIIK